MPPDDTLDRTLTSIVDAFPVASVETPVIIPFRYPVKVDVVPSPGIVAADIAVVTPNPMTIPALLGSSVVIPSVWSAALSINHTFKLFAQEPGVFAAYVNLVAVLKFAS